MRRTFVPADARTLQFDIDRAEDLVLFHRCLPWISCIFHETKIGLRALSYVQSRSRSHWHVTIKLRKPLKIIERIALQAILGSDRVRELCNYERYRARSAYPILLVDPVTKKRRPTHHATSQKRSTD